MYKPKYLYFLKYNGKYLFVKDGIVGETTTPTPLIISPDGWEEISIITERNKKYFGLDRSFTIPLAFIKDGGIILKYITYTYGQKATAELVIAERKFTQDLTAMPYPTYGIYYQLLFRGNADFSTFNQLKAKAVSNFIDGGIVSMMKTFEGTVKEIDISDGVPVYMDGVNLIGKQNMGFVDGYIMRAQDGTQFTIPLSVLSVEGKSTGISFFNSNYEKIPNFFPYFDDNLNYWATADENLTHAVPLRLTGKVNITLAVKRSYAPFMVNIIRIPRGYDGSNLSPGPINAAQTIPIYTNADPHPTVQGQTVTKAIDLIIPGVPGDKYFLVGSYNAVYTDVSDYQFEIESGFSANYVNRYPATEALSIEGEELFKRWVAAISSGKYTAKSDFLRANRDVVFTSGMAIRQLDKPVIKTSFTNIFNSVNTWGNVGFGIVDGVARLEDKRFFINTNTTNLAQCSNRVVSTNNDLSFNSLFFGYAPVDISEVNGRNEFNNTSQWSVNIPEVQREFKVISDYGASCYEMENLRANLDGKDTTDASADNKTFMIHTQRDVLDAQGRKLIDRSLNASATGVLSPESIFNLRLSPANCLRAWEWYIHGCFYGMDGEYLKFETSDKNQLLAAGGIIENASYLIGNLDPALFIPFDIEIECLNPPGYTPGASEGYNFIFDNVYLAGIAMKTGIMPNTHKSQKFTLLALASNDMTKLIYSNE